MRRILYLHHSVALGGSAVSLLYTLQGLDRKRYDPAVAIINPSEQLRRHFSDQGIETISWPGIQTFQHTALRWTALNRPGSWATLVRTAVSWKTSERRTRELVEYVAPDLVHLNSAVFVPSAHALYKEGIPFIWHVREGAAQGHFGLRYSAVRRAMLRWPSELIFLSEAERREWTGGERGQVVTNFVDFRKFDRKMDGSQVRKELGIDQDAPLILYLGGLNPVKGIFPLLYALAYARSRLPKLRCVMPGSLYSPSRRIASRLARRVLPLLGSGTHAQRIDRIINNLELDRVCIRTAFATRVERLLAACDLVVFPATSNHFARPVIEAGAMGKPVVASHFPILQEIVRHEETGLLVPHSDPKALGEAIVTLLEDPKRRMAFGESAYELARQKYDLVRNTNQIMEIYDRLLAPRNLLGEIVSFEGHSLVRR